MKQFERIIRECFLDSIITEEELQAVLKSGAPREKEQLFERILLNSSRYLLDLQLFDRDDLAILVEEYRLPEFNRDFVFRRKNIVEFFFFNKEMKIEELKWTA